MSLKRKNCRGLGFLRQSLVSTPSPTSTRPAIANGCETTICTAVNILSTKLALSYQHFPCYHQWLSSNHMYSCQTLCQQNSPSPTSTHPAITNGCQATICTAVNTQTLNQAHPLLPALSLLSPMAVKQPYVQLSTLCQQISPSPTSFHSAITNGCQATICTAVNTQTLNQAQPLLPALILAITTGCQANMCTAGNTLSTKHTLS